MKKRLFLFVAMIATIACLFAICASAATLYENDGVLDYKLDTEAKTAVVRSTNRTNCTASVVVIPETVTFDDITYNVVELENNVFDGNTYITTLVIYPKLTTIPSWMVQGATNLKKLYIDFSNVTSIGTRGVTLAGKDDANPVEGQEFFLYRPESYTEGDESTDVLLKDLDLSKVTSIGAGAFNNANIEKVLIGSETNQNVSISYQTFRFSTITEVDVYANEIPDYFCGDCASLTKVTIRKASKIGSNTFNGKALTSVSLCDGITSIGSSAFRNSANLTTISLPNSIQSIGSYAFGGCNNLVLASDYLPTSLTYLADNVFNGTKKLNSMLIFPVGYTAMNTMSKNDTFSGMSSTTTKLIFLGKMTYINIGYLGTNGVSIYLAQNSASELNGKILFGPEVCSNGQLGYYITTDTTDTNYTLKESGTLSVTLSGHQASGGNSYKTEDGKTWYYVNDSQQKFFFCKDNKVAYVVRNYNIESAWTTGCFAIYDTDATNTRLAPHVESSTGVNSDATCTTPAGVAYHCICCNQIARVEAIEGSAPLGHAFNVLTDIVYARFDVDGYKVNKCERCAETDSSVVAPAIFAHKGYSYRENGTKSGIYSEFSIDTSALQAYEEFHDTVISFGIAIFNPAKLTDGTTYFFNGKKINAETGIVQVELNENSRKYSRLNCLIDGFDKTNANHTALELVIAGFAYETNGSVQIMQKQYEVNAETPVDAPYLSKVTREDAVLYTVSIGTIEENVAFTDTIKEFSAPVVA